MAGGRQCQQTHLHRPAREHGAPNSQLLGLYRQTSLAYGNFAAQLRDKAEAREVFVEVLHAAGRGLRNAHRHGQGLRTRILALAASTSAFQLLDVRGKHVGEVPREL